MSEILEVIGKLILIMVAVALMDIIIILIEYRIYRIKMYFIERKEKKNDRHGI